MPPRKKALPAVGTRHSKNRHNTAPKQRATCLITPSTTLGVLGRLPPEVRNMIYEQHFKSCLQAEKDGDVPVRKAASLVRTSKKLRTETQGILERIYWAEIIVTSIPVTDKGLCQPGKGVMVEADDAFTKRVELVFSRPILQTERRHILPYGK